MILDIEISPVLATIWGLFNQNIGINQITGNSEVMCWAAKWHGSDDVYFSSIELTSKKRMLKEMYDLIEEADAIVTYNGKAFDLKILNKEFALQGWAAPSPYKNIDMLGVMRKQFRFTSNKLGYVAEQLKLGKKLKHQGHELWLHCMNPKSEEYKSSWDIMEEYNIQDVLLLESLYDRLLGWIHNHPNHSTETGEHVCPNCGGSHLQSRGTYTTASLSYRRYQCRDCGKWSRSRLADKDKKGRQVVGV